MKNYAFFSLIMILFIGVFAFPTVANAAIEVNIDIEPGKCPNPLDVETAEIVKITILADDSNGFNVQIIDPATIRLSREGYLDEIAPTGWKYKDAGTPFNGDLCNCHELKGDDQTDLVLKFNAQQVIELLGLDQHVGETIPLSITGNLNDVVATSIFGQDCVWMKTEEDFPVYFPDPNLEAAIREAINKPTGEIMYSDLQELTYLYANNKEIIELVGLQHCTHLKTLTLAANQITDVSPLSGLTKLRTLGLHYNQITDVSPLSELTKLSHLVLGYNQISDIGQLSGLVNLSTLYIDNNQISDVSPLSGLTELSFLAAWQNQISDIGPLSELTKLSHLVLGYNQISDIGQLSGLVNLSTLYIDNNQISDVSPLSGLTELSFLAAWQNQISDIGPLSGLTELSHLDIGINQISDIGPIVSNLGLGSGDSVWLSMNPLDSTSCTVYIPELINRGVSVYHECP